MRYATLCTGIGGFDAGFDRAEMECVYQCEINATCRQVLGRHWPAIPNGCDVNDEQTAIDLIRVRPDIVAFGSPCQDLSVAGRRGGLAAERSGLFYRCVECCFACEAPLVVWENVPGVFSSHGGEDFASVIEAFAGGRPSVPRDGWRNTGVCIGPLYSVAWAVLDAQWFGVAQRRRRVFLVASLGDRGSPYKILSLGEGLPWDSAPSREAGARVAHAVARGAVSSGYRYDPNGEDFIVGTLNSNGKAAGSATQQDAECGLLVTHTLRAEGHDASEDGTGRGVPIIAVHEKAGGDRVNGDAFQEELAYTLEARHHPQAVAYRTSGNSGVMEQGDRTAALNCGTDQNQNIVAYQCQGSNVGPMGTLKGQNETSGVPFIAFDERQITSKDNRSNPQPGDPCCTLHEHPPRIASRKVVRRLMPIEEERLQGFPDDHTRYGADGGEISDSARYRMLGNAVAVPVAEWIARRIISAI